MSGLLGCPLLHVNVVLTNGWIGDYVMWRLLLVKFSHFSNFSNRYM